MNKQEISDKLKGFQMICEGQYDPQNQKDNFILFVHAINSQLGMQCTGLLEDDPEEGIYEIPENWQKSVGGIYSLRYKVLEKTILFKFIAVVGNNISINCAYNDTLYTLQLDISKIDLQNPAASKNSEFLKDYEEKISNNIEFKAKQEQQQQQQQKSEIIFIPQQQQQQQQQPQFQQGIPVNPFGNNDIDPFSNNPNFQGNQVGPNNPLFIGGGGLGLGGIGGGNIGGIRQDPLNPLGGMGGGIPDNDMFRPPGQGRGQGGFGSSGGFGGQGGFGGGGFGGGGNFM